MSAKIYMKFQISVSNFKIPVSNFKISVFIFQDMGLCFQVLISLLLCFRVSVFRLQNLSYGLKTKVLQPKILSNQMKIASAVKVCFMMKTKTEKMLWLTCQAAGLWQFLLYPALFGFDIFRQLFLKVLQAHIVYYTGFGCQLL